MSPVSSPCVMIRPPIRRVDTPHDVVQACCTRLVARLELDVERLGEVLPEVVRRAGLERAPVAHQRLDRIGCERAGEFFALALPPVDTGIASSIRRSPCRREHRSVSSSASASVSCAVCPSCQRNSVVRMNGRVTFSQRTTLAHWLMSTGRSRHDMHPLGVHRADNRLRRRPHDQRLLELFVAALRHPGDLRREAFDVSASFSSRLAG